MLEPTPKPQKPALVPYWLRLEKEKREVRRLYFRLGWISPREYAILELRYNENHDPNNGRFTSGPGGSAAKAKNSGGQRLTNTGESGKLKFSKPEWSAKQAKEPFNYWELAEDKNAFPVNWKPTGFADGGYLEEHINKHITATGAKTPAEYLERAKTFFTSPRGKHGDAFVTKNGDVYRYDYDTHEFAIARKDGIIRTYWNLLEGKTPEAADAYWEGQK